MTRENAYRYYRGYYSNWPEAAYKRVFDAAWRSYRKHKDPHRLNWEMRVMKNPGVKNPGRHKAACFAVNPMVDVPECPKCHRKFGEKHKVVTKVPSLATMERWMDEGVARATDGCRVEPDGICPHGHYSWLVMLRMI